MATLREIKRRIKTAKNIGQVTRALEMVSAVKMRKAQAAALSGRSYTGELEKMIRVLASDKELAIDKPYLVIPEKVSRITLLVVAPQKGLCGALVGNLARKLGQFTSHLKTKTDINSFIYCPDNELACPLINAGSVDVSFVTVEKKSKDVIKFLQKPLLADFENTGSVNGGAPNLAVVRSIADLLVDLYKTKQTDLVLIAYSHFENTVSQKAVIRQFLPILPTRAQENQNQELSKAMIFEPSADEVFDSLLYRYSESLLYQIILESRAAEHSARMVAMKNAHDNASDIISELSLFYNKARQNAITSELADSVSGALVS